VLREPAPPLIVFRVPRASRWVDDSSNRNLHRGERGERGVRRSDCGVTEPARRVGITILFLGDARAWLTAVRRPPFVARRLSPAVRRPPFVARRSSPAVRRPPFVARRSSLAVRRPPFVARRSSPAVRRPAESRCHLGWESPRRPSDSERRTPAWGASSPKRMALSLRDDRSRPPRSRPRSPSLRRCVRTTRRACCSSRRPTHCRRCRRKRCPQQPRIGTGCPPSP